MSGFSESNVPGAIYRLGEVQATRKDLVESIDQSQESVETSFSVEVLAPFDLNSAEPEIKITRDSSEATIAVRVKGFFVLPTELDSVEAAREYVRKNAVPNTLHVAQSELGRFAREIDVPVYCLPLELEDAIAAVEPVYRGDDSQSE